jgi:hypothetical protein
LRDTTCRAYMLVRSLVLMKIIVGHMI